MVRASIAFVVMALFAGALLPMAVPSARAADVMTVTLIAKNLAWHVGSETAGVTTITVNVTQPLHLRIENRDTDTHTFTANQFEAVPNQGGSGSFLDVNLPPGRIFFWNHTMTASDAAASDRGDRQFYCIPHSVGNWPSREGMVGIIVVVTPSTPISLDPLLIGSILLVVVLVVAAVAVAMRRRKKAP